MFNKENYKQELFEKYSQMSVQGFQNSNSDFFKQKIKVKRHFALLKSFEIAALLILCFGVSIYAYNEVTKTIKEIEPIEQEANNINENLLYYQDMDVTNSVYYKIVENYEEYINLKEIYNDLIEIEENDFENVFVFVAIVQGKSYISDIYVDDETLYVDITRDYENEENRGEKDFLVSEKLKVVSTKISNELKRDNIKIKELPLDSNLFVPIQQLIERDDYTPEEAVKDGYVVTEYHIEDYKTYLLSDESVLDDFMKKVENNEEVKIRSIDFSMGLIKFVDVKYYNGVFSIYTYYKDKTDSSESFGEFEIGNYLRCVNYDGSEIDYWIQDSNNAYVGVCELCRYNLKK